MAQRRDDFQTIRSEGGLLPPDLLRRVIDPKEKFDGTRPEDYSLSHDERLGDSITQSWSRLRKRWDEFQKSAKDLPHDQAGTGLTNDKWSLPLLQELGFGLLPAGAGPEVGGRTFAISRIFGPVPIHLVGCGLSLDRRVAGVRGAAISNPHGLVQEFLNRSPEHLWAIVSNGLRLRILRDSMALSRQSFLEFDLETMFSGEVYSDFVLFWLVAHASRFAPHDPDQPESCWLEHWSKLAIENGTRALGELRGGVERALQVLGEGFTSHPKNSALRETLREGHVSLSDFHGQLLRVVYRLIFLFVAEDRNIEGQPLLHTRNDSETGQLGRERFAAHYSTSRLREMAGAIKGSRHGDLWSQFQVVAGALSGDERFASARKELSLPALGSFLWDPVSTISLNDSELSNFDFLETIRCLSFTRQGKMLRPVDYKNLGAEELGSVYESLLALTPQISGDGARFTFSEFAGSERKTSGSYYTPDELVQCLLDSALDPVVNHAIVNKSGVEAENAILNLKICDPAVGSGHFLVGSAHRLAQHLARVRAISQGESEPSPLLYQHALRDVIGRCLYGVDLNPMAAELCRVSLWIEALEPGKPLSFLDHHIRVGNSLLGTTPELIAAGLPDDAFKPIAGDDKKVCSALRKRNKQEREGRQRDMLHLMAAEPKAEYDSIVARIHSIDETPDSTIGEIQHKTAQFRSLVISPEYQHAQKVSDSWCAAFMWQKQANVPIEPLTTDTIFRLEVDSGALTSAQHSEVERLSGQYQFFHWHLAFPEVFIKGGFDCVLGNPPWEKINLKLEEYFALRRPEIAGAATKAHRTTLLKRLSSEAPKEYAEYEKIARMHNGLSHYFRVSGAFPATGVSRINLYSLFAERGIQLLAPNGRLGMLFPTGIATDQNNKDLFFGLAQDSRLISVFDFENRGLFFPDVHSQFRFCLFIAAGSSISKPPRFGFFLTSTNDIEDRSKVFELTSNDLRLLSPESGTAPIFRNGQEAILARTIYRRHKTISQWANRIGTPQTPFNMANDSYLFLPYNAENTESLLPLLEGKHIGPFNWRAARGSDSYPENVASTTEEVLNNPDWFGVVRHYLPKSIVQERYPAIYRIVYRQITNATNERTSIATLAPPVAVGHTLTQMNGGEAEWALFCVACLNSFVFDFVARIRMSGTSLTHWIVKQIPIPEPDENPKGIDKAFIDARAVELSLNDNWLSTVLRGCGWNAPPFRWNEERRFILRCELDAAFFHLYLPADANGHWRSMEGDTSEEIIILGDSFPMPRDAVSYIMDTFPLVRRRDEEKFDSDYRTKRIILEIYDALSHSIQTGQPYQSNLDPAPGFPIGGLPIWKPHQSKSPDWPPHIHPPKE